MNRTLTHQQLLNAGACREQRDDFVQAFPTGTVEVTEELAIQFADKFDWDWAAEYLLSAPARAEYDKVTAAARARGYNAS